MIPSAKEHVNIRKSLQRRLRVPKCFLAAVSVVIRLQDLDLRKVAQHLKKVTGTDTVSSAS